MDSVEITASVAAGLVAAQFPHWAELPLTPVLVQGHDNTTFRLGDQMSIRLPNHARYVPQVDKELRWLPALAPALPVSIPMPIALGHPTEAFPRPWSVYAWIPGRTASVERIAKLDRFAVDLAAALRALYAIDASAGPRAGEHNFHRGGPLQHYDAQFRMALGVLKDQVDLGLATELWERAIDSAWRRPPVWVHGDVVPSNLLVEQGRLCALLDFGCTGVGDPACDLTIAWTLFMGQSRRTFRAAMGLGGDTWLRARGWALWKTSITLAEARQQGGDPDAAARRAGWSAGTRETLDAVLTDQ